MRLMIKMRGYWIRAKATIFNNKNLDTTIDLNDVANQDVNVVADILCDSGFSNVVFSPIEDVNIDNMYLLNKIEKVLIDDKDSMCFGQSISYDSKIDLYYHSRECKQIDVKKRDLRKLGYKELYEYLRTKGFTNIVVEPIPDVILGLFTKSNKIYDIYINSSSRIKKDSFYEFDTPICIIYHTKEIVEYGKSQKQFLRYLKIERMKHITRLFSIMLVILSIILIVGYCCFFIY